MKAAKQRFELALEAVDRVIERALSSGKYPPGDTWRGVPYAEHLAHARAHLELLSAGDTSELHLEHRQRLCASCADSAEGRAGSLRRAFEKAAAKSDIDFMVCSNCCVGWIPGTDINYAVRGWTMIITSEGYPAAVLCGACAASHPEPATLPSIAHLVLWRSRGPMQ